MAKEGAHHCSAPRPPSTIAARVRKPLDFSGKPDGLNFVVTFSQQKLLMITYTISLLKTL